MYVIGSLHYKNSLILVHVHGSLFVFIILGKSVAVGCVINQLHPLKARIGLLQFSTLEI